MSFTIAGKVALVTGGASGIGLKYVQELLANGLRGVALVDINNNVGDKALKELEAEFGSNKAIFIKADVTDLHKLEDAFKKCIETFKNLDILVNNAGILNDKIWEKEIAINVNGVVHGILLALEKYIPKHRTGAKGVIVNISSIAGLIPSMSNPIYCATKLAVLGMGTSFGHADHYQETKIKVLTVCPGVTDTPLIADMSKRNLGERYERFVAGVQKMPIQTPKQLAEGVIEVIKRAESGTVWVIEGGHTPYQFILPSIESFVPPK